MRIGAGVGAPGPGGVGAVRPLGPDDLDDAMRLYAELMGAAILPEGPAARTCWAAILSRPGTTVLGLDAGGAVASMATLHLLPNMSFGGRPNAVADNVVTLEGWRGRGLGRRVMGTLVARAWAAGAYKVALTTARGGAAEGFYRRLGFDPDEKTAFVLRPASGV